MLPYDVFLKTQEFLEAVYSGKSRKKKKYPVAEKKTPGHVAGPFEKYEQPETGEVLYRHKKLPK